MTEFWGCSCLCFECPEVCRIDVLEYVCVVWMCCEYVCRGCPKVCLLLMLIVCGLDVHKNCDVDVHGNVWSARYCFTYSSQLIFHLFIGQPQI